MRVIYVKSKLKKEKLKYELKPSATTTSIDNRRLLKNLYVFLKTHDLEDPYSDIDIFMNKYAESYNYIMLNTFLRSMFKFFTGSIDIDNKFIKLFDITEDELKNGYPN